MSITSSNSKRNQTSWKFGENTYYYANIPEEIKDLIRKDNELHYLIGALGYEYKEI